MSSDKRGEPDVGRVRLGQLFPGRASGSPYPAESQEAPPRGGAESGMAQKTKAPVQMGFERHSGSVAVTYYYRGVPLDVVIVRGEADISHWRTWYLEGQAGEGHLVDVVDVTLPAKRRGKELVVLIKTHEGLPDGCAVCWADEEAEAREELIGQSYAGWGNDEADTVTRFVVEYPREVVPRLGFERLGSRREDGVGE